MKHLLPLKLTLAIFAVLVYSHLFLVHPVLAVAPTATISLTLGSKDVIVGSPLMFSVNASGENLTGMELWRAPQDANLGTAPEKGGPWKQIGNRIPCNGITCSADISWTPDESDLGSYYIVVNVYSNPNNENDNSDKDENCSGNPKYTTPGWTRCNTDGDYIPISVSESCADENLPPRVEKFICTPLACELEAVDDNYNCSDAPASWRLLKSARFEADGKPITDNTPSAPDSSSNVLGEAAIPNVGLLDTAIIPPNTCRVQGFVQDFTGRETVVTFRFAPDVICDGTISDWGTRILNSLERGSDTDFNRMVRRITNGSYTTQYRTGAGPQNWYWCTYSIIDAYNLASINGLTIYPHGAVDAMRQFWKSNPGYKFIDYETNPRSLISVYPGFAMFLQEELGQTTQREHVVMVKKIDLDYRGNGRIYIQQSNSHELFDDYPIDNYEIKNTKYPVRGFGGL